MGTPTWATATATPVNDQQYIIASGDTCWSIASNNCGDGSQWQASICGASESFCGGLSVGQTINYNCGCCSNSNNGGNNNNGGGISDGEIIGFYSWSWEPSTSQGPAGANNPVAFIGHASIDASLNAWANDNGIGGHTFTQQNGVNGVTTWLSVGGGTDPGRLNAEVLKEIGDQCAKVKDNGFGGIMFDVEKVSGSADTLIPLFDEAFSKCKQVGLQVGLTTSHSAPYEADSPSDAKRLVESWCANGGDLDLISPQLYTTGYETAPDFAVTSSCASVGCGWELYHNCNPKFVPSIVEDSHYTAVQAWASGTAGVQAEGFFQWKMVV